MRENYNRPQLRGYWDAPKSKDDSRYATFCLLFCVDCLSLIPAVSFPKVN